MKYRNLGKSSYQVSEIGLGCWQLGGDFGPIDGDVSQHILQAADDNDINFFDTADVYGGGKSESEIAKHTTAHSKDRFIATKVGRSSELYPDTYSVDAIRDNVLRSRDRLQTSSIDLLQLHCVPKPVLVDAKIFDVMEELKQDGVIKHWGASVETIDEALLCLKQQGLTSLQIIFNVFRQDAIEQLFPQAQAANVGIIVRLPLASGLLSGKYTVNSLFDESDHRNYNKDGQFFSVGETFSGIEFEKGVALADELKEHVPDGWSLADLSLRWILDQEAVSSIIAGCSRPDQVDRNARASDLPSLPQETHEFLAKFYTQNVRHLVRSSI